MALQFQKEADEVKIYTFSLQYPSFLFPGKTQYSLGIPPKGVDIKVAVNSVNPVNWLMVGNEIKKLCPDIVIIRYWMPFMGPCLGTISRIIKRNKHTKLVCLVDNLIPHEKRMGDEMLTRYFVKPFDGFITMSQTVMNDTEKVTNAPVVLHEHPLIDNFGDPVSKQEARKYLGLEPDEKYILFFGFIRKYKGLDLLLDAIKILKDRNASLPKLIIAGEFYGNAEAYHEQIKTLGIEDALVLRTDFIPNEEVKYYLSACDFLIQPYRDATQSGVTPLAYHFEKPMLVTNVGGLADIVPDGKAGVVTEAEPAAIAAGIERLYTMDEALLIANVKQEKEKFSWESFTDAIRKLADF
ncbi:glycosyltransferase [Haoranjiania flava]|uniref:Glycosyltransferase n=1 Tax=Haoranjiania flava TaxID=1856322 RepID=A0AAE3IPR9_9BACT|nr:glycosyltransferase [Haoranjiania flava]MCU7695090.1 glycosyltransferase [Haoranjiania flava]